MLALVVGVLAFAVPDARAQGANEAATIYRLNEVGSFQQGCFPPCLCPIQRAGDLSGTFVLAPKGFDGLSFTKTSSGSLRSSLDPSTDPRR